MKLDDLLKNITLPLTLRKTPNAAYLDSKDGAVMLLVGPRNARTDADELHAAYIAHAANVLPELVAAAEAARETMRALHAYNHSENDRKAILSRSLGALAAALARASEVKGDL